MKERLVQTLLASNDILNNATAFRERAKRDGYLLFRGLLDPDAILNVRRQFIEILARHGWLDAGTPPMEAISGHEGPVEGVKDYWPVFDDFQKLEDFHALAHAPALVEMYAQLFGEPLLVHPRNIGRIMFPPTPVTPPHQDHLPIRGTLDTWTAWIPQGDVSAELGGLAVLPASHLKGIYPTKPMRGAGGRGIELVEHDPAWATTEFRVGDVLTFHSLTVHRGQPNHTPNRIRLSCDYRYQAVSQPVAPGSLLPHMTRTSWDEIYRGWKSTRYQHYWEKLPLTIVKPEGPVQQY